VDGFYSDTFSIGGSTLAEMNRSDVRDGLTATAQRLIGSNAAFTSLTQAQRETAVRNVVDNLMLQDRDFANLSPDEQALQANLRSEYRTTILAGAPNEAASDIYGGVTNNVVSGSWGHTPPTSTNYWFDQNLNPVRETNKECFAEYFGRVMTNDPEKTDGLNSMTALLPGSKAFLDQMLTGMG
jgi:hypothetical protein